MISFSKHYNSINPQRDDVRRSSPCLSPNVSHSFPRVYNTQEARNRSLVDIVKNGDSDEIGKEFLLQVRRRDNNALRFLSDYVDFNNIVVVDVGSIIIQENYPEYLELIDVEACIWRLHHAKLALELSEWKNLTFLSVIARFARNNRVEELKTYLKDRIIERMCKYDHIWLLPVLKVLLGNID